MLALIYCRVADKALTPVGTSLMPIDSRLMFPTGTIQILLEVIDLLLDVNPSDPKGGKLKPVIYTHFTLPT